MDVLLLLDFIVNYFLLLITSKICDIMKLFTVRYGKITSKTYYYKNVRTTNDNLYSLIVAQYFRKVGRSCFRGFDSYSIKNKITSKCA